MRTATAEWRFMLRELIGAGDQIKMEGRAHEPRDRRTLEILGYQSRWDMNEPLVRCPNRKLNPKFAAAESLWIISGSNLLEPPAAQAHYLRNFSDDGVTLSGAYGPKFVDQLPYVVNALTQSRASRQAVCTLWRERPGPSKDVPCTIALQWLIRDGQLHCVTSMRSSDAWLGIPYDVWAFSVMSKLVLLRLTREADLPLELGELILTCGSQHLYAIDWVAAEKCAMTLEELDQPKLRLPEVKDEAELILRLTEMQI